MEFKVLIAPGVQSNCPMCAAVPNKRSVVNGVDCEWWGSKRMVRGPKCDVLVLAGRALNMQSTILSLSLAKARSIRILL